ncbi:hypothetical protein HU200_007921 [Digitaria exilis]|uniref:Uncharacterized protein n=1 Tax=Digitaria exilis TaxID=1010633 RepID=A0A835FMR7_9POAL|nr:hypothetical protein HU200_007921 [Digitaria exilis]
MATLAEAARVQTRKEKLDSKRTMLVALYDILSPSLLDMMVIVML